MVSNRTAEEAWRQEVANGDTQLGFNEWKDHQREGALAELHENRARLLGFQLSGTFSHLELLEKAKTLDHHGYDVQDDLGVFYFPAGVIVIALDGQIKVFYSE